MKIEKVENIHYYLYAALAVGLALVTGLLVMSTLNGIERIAAIFDSDMRAQVIAFRSAVLPAKVIFAYVGYTILALGGIGFVIAGVVKAIGWSMLQKIDHRQGLYPVVFNPFTRAFYDPQRDNAGAHPMLAMGALEVQKAAALTPAQTVRALPQAQGEAEVEASEADPLPELIKLRDVCTRPDLNNLVLGQTENGQILKSSLFDLMHVLAVGASGWGKSAFLRMLIWQFAQASQEVDIVAIDISGSEFNVIRRWDKLMFPVARETNEAVATLQAVSQEIERRKELYEAHPTAYDLESYNKRADDHLNPLVLLTDEGTNLLNQDGVGEPLRDVAQTARQYGVYLLLAGQSANHKVVPTQVRDNFTSRFCFHTSPASRRVVLGQSVDDISAKGRAWSQLPGREIEQIQVPFVSREEVEDVIGNGKPRRDMPEVIDIAQAQMIEDDTSLTDNERIRLLHSQGIAQYKIEERVFGHSGGDAYRKVKAVLDGLE